MNRRLFSFFILNLILSFSFGQRLEFEHLYDNDGLASSSISTMVKDSYGYIWFGTFNGLSRYDGYSFVNYINDPKNDSSITENSIRYVYETRDSTLYVSFSYSGVCIFNRETESFTRLRHNPQDPASISHDCVVIIYQDKKGNIWMGTKAGLDLFDPKTKTFKHFLPPGKDQYFVSSILEDEVGNLWLYGRGNYVYKFNPSKNLYEKIIFSEQYDEGKFSTWGGDILYDSKGYLWIAGDGGNGLYRYTFKTGETRWYSVKTKKLQTDIILSLIKDSEGRIWIGSDGEGVYIYDYENDSFRQYTHDPNDLKTLSGNGVHCIYQSEPGIIWVGVFDGGANIYNKHKHKFRKFTSLGPPGKCLSHRSVLSIAENKDGRIWLGTDGGGLDLFDPKTSQFIYYKKDNSIIPAKVIKSIAVDDEEDCLWLGTYDAGLIKVNFEKGLVKNFRGNITGTGKTILNDYVWDLVISHDKKIWAGLLNLGINIYDPETNHFTYYQYDSTEFKNEHCSVYTLFEDSKKRMWVGLESGGFGYYDPDKKTFIKFKKEEGKPGPITSNSIRDIFEDSKGTIWIATFKGGLIKVIDIEKKIFESITVEDGLPTNNINSILEDDHHNLWLSTNEGITLFKVDQKKFISYNVEDGLQSKEFRYGSALKAKNGYMYFGGIQGFNMFHPDSIPFNSKPPVIRFTNFKIFNKTILPYQPYNDKIYLTKAIDFTDEIQLDHKDVAFSIEFAALDLTAPKKNQYAYRLLGFTDQWTYVNADKRVATYTNLDPGEYTFQVIASNNDGVWNKQGTTLKIIILPPWYSTWWFRISFVIILIGLIIGSYYYRVRSIREKNHFLELEVKKRTAEILEQQEEIVEQKNQLEKKKQELEHLNKTKDKFFSIIGHDLKGPVKALTSLTKLLKDEAPSMINEKQKMLTTHIDSSSNKIQNLILNLLEWARTQSRQVKIEPVVVSVLQLLKENIELLNDQASQKQIAIHLNTNQDHMIFADYNMVCTVVRNILSNSIKYTPKGGTIRITSSRTEEGETKISISDSGIGMSEEILNSLFILEKSGSVKGTDNEMGTGLGMIIAKEFVDLNKGKIYAESTLGKGSVFHLIIPSAEQLT